MTDQQRILDRALDFYGLREIPGEKNNPTILKFFTDVGHKWVQSDETAWCSAFINWLAWDLRLSRSGELDARSWLNVGEETPVPNKGDIAILWRESIDSWKGHVGLYIRSNDSYIWLLGGNQSNEVNISAYPIGRVLEYRKLSYHGS